MDTAMTETICYVINGFTSYANFSQFKICVEEAVSSGLAIEIAVAKYFVGENFIERWFRFDLSGTTWRLVYPDSPFPGFWGPVPNEEA